MKKHAGPIIVAVLLLLPMLYLGSYLALVDPSGDYLRDPKDRKSTAFPFTIVYYRAYHGTCSKIFWPLEQIDRKVRPKAWDMWLDAEFVTRHEANTDIDFDALANNPGVANVDTVLFGEPAIIQLVDWHYLDKAALAKAEGLEGEELEAEYAKVLETAEAVRKSKLLILADVPELFQEGLTDDNQETVAAEILSLVAFHTQLRCQELEDADHERTLLRLNAAAELLLDGKPIKILPAESHEAHEAARGKPLDHEAHKAREVAIVNRIVKHGKTSWLVLGGGHDLTEAIKAQKWGYVRVTPKGYQIDRPQAGKGRLLNDERSRQIERALGGGLLPSD